MQNNVANVPDLPIKDENLMVSASTSNQEREESSTMEVPNDDVSLSECEFLGFNEDETSSTPESDNKKEILIMLPEPGGEPEFVDTPTDDVVPSFSFSGCGFLGVYHVGVAACLMEHTDVVNRPEIRFAGASAGALVATSMLCGMDFGEMTRILLDIAQSVRDNNTNDLEGRLRRVLMKHLPEDAHLKLSGRLYISMTVLDGMECGLVSDFESKDHLIQCLIATCFVPGFLGWLPPTVPANSFMDNGAGFPHLSREERIKRERRRRREQDGNPTPRPGRTYIQRLVRLCLQSLTTTRRIVKRLPMATTVMKTVLPKAVSQLDEFAEAILLELLANTYAVFDGGFSDNIPAFDSNTITVCPFAGEAEICPKDKVAMDLNLDLGNTSMQVSEENAHRLSHALSPMAPATLQRLCEDGYNECLKYLNKKDLLCCRKHLMTRATLTTSACNIGHSHCQCHKCKAHEPKVNMALTCLACQRVKKKALTSHLPEEIQIEFRKAIENDSAVTNTSTSSDDTWSRIVSMVWSFLEKVYSSTISMAELSVIYKEWTVRLYDSYAIFSQYTMLSVNKKRRMVRSILSSLHNSISRSLQINGARPICNGLQLH